MKKLTKRSREYIISFDILTKSISLDDLSKKIGINSSSGSRNKGQKNEFGKRNWTEKNTWFRLFSVLPKTSKLERHLDSIIKRVEKSNVFRKGTLPKDNRLSICIAENYDFNERAYYQIDIPEKYVVWCGKHRVSLEVVAYPCS